MLMMLSARFVPKIAPAKVLAVALEVFVMVPLFIQFSKVVLRPAALFATKPTIPPIPCSLLPETQALTAPLFTQFLTMRSSLNTEPIIPPTLTWTSVVSVTVTLALFTILVNLAPLALPASAPTETPLP